MSKKAQETPKTENTEDRTKIESIVDELLDKVMGGAELCQHCNQPCGDCTQPPPPNS